MTTDQLAALKLLGECTSNYFNVWDMAGPGMAGARARCMSLLTGSKMPKSKSGVNALCAEFYKLFPPIDGCLAEQRDIFAQRAAKECGGYPVAVKCKCGRINTTGYYVADTERLALDLAFINNRCIDCREVSATCGRLHGVKVGYGDATIEEAKEYEVQIFATICITVNVNAYNPKAAAKQAYADTVISDAMKDGRAAICEGETAIEVDAVNTGDYESGSFDASELND